MSLNFMLANKNTMESNDIRVFFLYAKISPRRRIIRRRNHLGKEFSQTKNYPSEELSREELSDEELA
jgi:hypothetical protein